MRKKRSGTGKNKNMYTRYRRKTSHSQTLTVNGNGNGIGDASATSGSTRSGMFYGCYLLASLSPRYKGHTYIGFTVNPKRRIRQHNGEISSGASTTKKKRPWEMVLCIHGFPTHVAALQFEWAWQHPTESLAVRQAAAAFKTLGGLANKIKLALTMLSLPSWHCMDLTVSFFSTKYMKHTAGCPTLPHHIKLHFCSMDELPCYSHPHHSPLQDQEDDLLSHSTQLFGTDDRQLSSLDGHFEMNCFQINTIQKENETWEHTGVPTLESSSVDDHMQLLLHQVPFDVAGNSTYDLLQLDEQIWSEGFTTPFPIPDKHHAEADPSSQLLYPVTKQHMQPLHLFPAAGSEESSLNEQLQHRKEVTRKEQRSWSNRQAESSPMDEYATVPEKFAKKSDMICVLIDDSTKEKSQPTDDQSHSRVANTIQMSSVEGIEVIDLLTPTPDCRIRGGSKKRRIACNSPDIIDLTRSPLFVQL